MDQHSLCQFTFEYFINMAKTGGHTRKKTVGQSFYFLPAQNAPLSIHRNPRKNRQGTKSEAIERGKGAAAMHECSEEAEATGNRFNVLQALMLKFSLCSEYC